MIVDFIVEAGWGIWPVLLLGGLTLGLALRHAAAPDPTLVPLCVGFGVATLLFGLLGTVTGLQASVRYVAHVEAPDRWLFLVGLRESLQNLVAALLLTALAALATTLGAYRQARRPAPGGTRQPA